MLDIRFIRENADQVRAAIVNKNISLDLDELLAADEARVRCSQEIEVLQA